MHDRPLSDGKVLSLMIVWLIAVSGAIAVLGALPGPARAATCSQGSNPVPGNWTVTTAQVCTGIVYTIDGSVTVSAGGSLTLVNGGLSFSKDALHADTQLLVEAGGALILDHSIVTVQTKMIQPYLKLAFTVTGAGSSLTLVNGSVLKFPGWFNATGATVTLTNSGITGFQPSDLYGLGLDVDDNDNSPIISWSSTTATLYHSSVSRIYENASASGGTNVTGPVEGNVTLTSGSRLYAYDSYIAVDYSNVIGLHNELRVDGSSNAYLYNVTIDRSEDPFLESDWTPAFVPTAPGGAIYLLRWFHAKVLDSTGFPVIGASIVSTLSPAATTAAYPDNGLSTIPSSRTLAYLGRNPSGPYAWNMTDGNGEAVIPLYTDQITTTSLPNANSFGNYQISVSFQTSTASSGVTFNPYPALSVADNNAWIQIPMSGVRVRTLPDLALYQSNYTRTLPELEGQAFPVHALVFNRGQTSAAGISVAAFLDGNRSKQVGRVDGLALLPSTFVNTTLNITGISTSGAHTLELIVDPDNTIDEGGALQESNNFANISLDVQPPPPGYVAIGTPAADATVTPGSTLTVNGYVRDTNVQPIPGIVVTVQLLSATGAIAAGTATTDASGFFAVNLAVPGGTPDGTYTVSVASSATSIQPMNRQIAIRAPASFLNQLVPLLGIPWWLFLAIVAVVALLVIMVTVYFKVYGIGKMVECGECGSFIPEDATVCPRCGVEFEKDMAKCSNCGTWIPVDVKQCPECGVEFATGELDMADYQERMRLQFDDVVRKLKEDASRQLSRSLSDQEFQEWWRKQPSFLTFEDWLREEEDMRKQGSKACPVCGTLNSVTAKVCHKCGSFMRAPAPGATPGKVIAGAPKRAVRPAPRTEEPEGEPAPPEAILGPVVQKRVVKRGPTETDQGTGESTTDQDL